MGNRLVDWLIQYPTSGIHFLILGNWIPVIGKWIPHIGELNVIYDNGNSFIILYMQWNLIAALQGSPKNIAYHMAWNIEWKEAEWYHRWLNVHVELALSLQTFQANLNNQTGIPIWMGPSRHSTEILLNAVPSICCWRQWTDIKSTLILSFYSVIHLLI